MAEEFTEEELAMLSGEDVEDELPPAMPEESDELPAEDPPATEEKPISEPVQEPDEVAKLKKANSGLLDELIRTRKSGKDDREWRQGVQNRLDAMADRLDPEPTPEPEVVPDREEDPFAWMAYQQKKNTEEAVKPLQEKIEADEHKQDVGKFVEQFTETTHNLERDFLTSAGMEKEVYDNSLDAVRDHRAKWYTATGMEADAAINQVQVDELAFIANCLQEGMNPAAEAMRMYEALGLKPLDKPTQEAAKPGGGLDKVAAVKKGQRTDMLSNVPADGDASIITFEQFSDMPEDDPIAVKIMGNPKKFMEIQVHGQVSL